MTKLKLVLLIHNVRSSHNVGSILRSADGFGIDHVYLTGYTPYPTTIDDNRLPHISERVERQIQKTALGAEKNVSWSHETDIFATIQCLKEKKYLVAALEQTSSSRDLSRYVRHENLALIVGNEVEGIDDETIHRSDLRLEIPMKGKKESFNVAVAASIAMYHLTVYGQKS